MRNGILNCLFIQCSDLLIDSSISDDEIPRSKQRESSLSVSSRTSGPITSKNLNDFGPYER